MQMQNIWIYTNLKYTNIDIGQFHIQFSSSKFIHCFNQQNSSHGIYDSESFIGSNCDAKNVNTVKSAT